MRIASSVAIIALLAGAGQVAAQRDSTFSRDAARAILLDVRRITTPNGIERLEPVRIGDVRQWISVRGRDTANPLLLFIHGGPGFSEMPASWIYQAALEDHFTVVQWDQRGAGKSTFDENGQPLSRTVTFDRMIEDGVEMVAYLRRTYNHQRIFVAGHSWGSIIGLELARAHPDWLHAYIGIGQVINSLAAERVSYDWVLAEARKRGNREAVAQLEAIAGYPAPADKIKIQDIIVERRWVNEFGGMSFGRTGLEYEFGARVLSPEWTSADLAADDNGEILVRLLPDLLRRDSSNLTTFECPIVIFAGRYDYAVPSQVVEQWFQNVRAPAKKFIWFENTAHMIQMERPGLFASHLINDVRPLLGRRPDRD